MSYRALHIAGYGSMSEERRKGAEWLHGEKENVGKSIEALLDDPSLPIPTGKPFVPDPFVPAKPTAPTVNGLRFIPLDDPINALARSIALGSGLVNIARTTNFLEVLNGIIEANNAYYSDPGIQKRGKDFNYDVDIGHTVLRQGRMPCWQASDKEALIHGRMNNLSRMGKIAQVIYAMPLAAIIEAVSRQQREREACLNHMRKKPVGLDKDLWEEQARRIGIDVEKTKIRIHKKSRKEVLIASTYSIKSTEIEKILDIPACVYFTLDGTPIDMIWSNGISEFLNTKKLQDETRFRIALAAEG